jgi:hypothetical protein
MHVKYAREQGVQLELLHPGDRVKTAGAMPEVQSVLDSLKSEAAYTYALVNAMGYSEFYGTNSNADWYGYCPELNFNGLLHAWPDIGENLETDRMKGRDWPYGYPCFYGATVYAHHKNTNPAELGFGDVRYVFANPVMKRVELLMRIHNEEARKKGHLNIVERIVAGERCDVSMGAKIPWDACSICTDWEAVRKAWKTFDPKRHLHWGVAVLEQHKQRSIRGIAVTSADYCVHIRTQRNHTLPDGRRVFMYNVFPRFFDISCVFIGADRTARVMWHKTDGFRDDAPIPQPMRAARLRLDDLFSQKTASKMAELDKEVPGGTIEKVLSDSDSAPEFRFDLLGKDPRALLSSAAALGILLSPPEFQRLLGGDGQSFSTATSHIDDGMAVAPRLVDDQLLAALRDLVPERSGFKPFMGPRIAGISVQISRGPARAALDNEKVAALYNGYRLSVLGASEKLADRARHHLIEEASGARTSSSPLAALLLGVLPMVHLVAAHLRREEERQQLGTMASLLADNPTFFSLAALGEGIRIAMAAESGGLLPAALRLIDNSKKTG